MGPQNSAMEENGIFQQVFCAANFLLNSLIISKVIQKISRSYSKLSNVFSIHVIPHCKAMIRFC